MKDLHDTAQSMLDEGQSREDVYAYLCEVAVAHPDMGLPPFLGLNRKIGRLPASDAVRILGEHWSKTVQKRRVQDVLSDYAHKNGLDRWLADFILTWIEKGEPPPLAETSISTVGEVKIGPKDNKVTLVHVVANQLCDPIEVAERFLAQCAKTFPPETFS